jgi:hypothetical protein
MPGKSASDYSRMAMNEILLVIEKYSRGNKPRWQTFTASLGSNVLPPFQPRLDQATNLIELQCD